MAMALNILESERIDRYILEVFVGQMNFIVNCNANKKDANESKVNRLYYTCKTFKI